MTVELALLPRVAYRGREITSARLRALLALLAKDVRTGCSTSRLLDGLWADEQPENPIKALQILVSRARSQLDPDLIATTPTGYRLNLDDNQVDASAIALHASSSAQHARAGDHAAALAQAEAGLALWDGTRVDEGMVDAVAQVRAEREPTCQSLSRSRALALARLGRYAEAVELLAELTGERPRDEELLLELLRSEAATAGPSAALTRYEGYRSELRDELGTDPGTALQAFHQELLRDTAPPVRHGVEYEPNPLLGRDDDIAAVEKLLRTSRVASITGAGGLGKTRLAHAVLRQAEQRAGFFVALAGITADDDVIGEVAAAVGAGESRHTAVGGYPRDLFDSIVTALGAGPTLLVLDNCEHVLRGAAELVHALVSMTKELRVLTTSRAPLGLSSESVYILPELTLPAMVELFTQRARAARPAVDLPEGVVTEICGHLDGLPLGVELAAARVRVMSVPEIAHRLDDRFSLLQGGTRDTPERHRTLQAVVEWSWSLLEPAAQKAMRTLSVLPGGFTADTAEHMVGAERLETLEQLVEQSLLTVTDSPTGTRFRMLETVREFSMAEQRAAGEEEQVASKLLAWARGFALAHHEAPFDADPYSAVTAIRAEQDNLAYAIRQALAREDGPTVAAVAAVLATLWLMESNYPRMSSLAEETSWLFSHYRPEPDLVEITRTALVLSAGYTFLIEGPRAVRPLVGLRRLPPASPGTFSGAVSTILEGTIHDPAALHELCDSDESLVAGSANGLVSYVWEAQNDLDKALAAADRMLEACEEWGITWLNALAHSRIGELSFHADRSEKACRHLITALPVIERLGASADAAGIRWLIVLAHLQAGDVAEAERWMESVVPGQVDAKMGTRGYDLGARAEVALARGEVDAGLRLWRCVVDVLRDGRDPISAVIAIGIDPWAVEARAVAVVAHAQHGHPDLVAGAADEVVQRVLTLLTTPIANPPPYIMEFQLAGTAVLALAMVDLDRARRAGDRDAIRSAVRMIALAGRLGYLRNFQPTMASARIREVAEQADRPAYEEALSSYADLDHDGLRAETLTALRGTATTSP